MDAIVAWWNSLSQDNQIALIAVVLTAVVGVVVAMVTGFFKFLGNLIVAGIKGLFKHPTDKAATPASPTQSQQQQVIVNVNPSSPFAPTLPVSPSPSLRAAPPLPRVPDTGFVPRYDADGHDLIAFVSALLDAGHGVTLLGEGGRGKTTLAAEIARGFVGQIADLPNTRVVWIGADGRTGFTLGTLLDDTAAQLGNEQARTLAPEPKMLAVNNLLAQARTLLVCDNFETIDAAEQKAIAEFFHSAQCLALVTSRVPMADSRAVTIGAMSVTEARDFLARLIDVSPKRDALKSLNADDIAAAAERNPAVMRWIVGQLAQAQRLRDVFDELARGHGDAATRVFGRSFGLLGADAQAALLALSLFAPSGNREAVGQIANLPYARVNEALRQLSALQLLETDAPNERLAVIGLTRRFARAQLDADALADEFRARFVAYFLQYAEAHAETTPEDFDALEAEKDNLLAAMDMAFELKDWESVMRMMNAIFGTTQFGFLPTHGYWDEAIKRGEQAVAAARAAKNEWNTAGYSTSVATIRKNRGEYDEARRAYQETLDVFKKLKSEKNVAVLLHELGILAQNQGDLDEAWRLYQESLEIKKKLGNQSGIASTLHQLGKLAQDQGNLSEARRLYQESLEITKKLGNQSGASKTLNTLGNIATDEGKFDEARDLLTQSLEIAKRLGEQLQIGYASWGLGLLAEKEGDKAEAARLLREALTIFEKLGSPMAKRARRDLERVEGKDKG